MTASSCSAISTFRANRRGQSKSAYLREYGSTLGGLVANHGVDADAYHDFVNDIEALELCT